MNSFYYRGYDVSMLLYDGVWYCNGVNYLNGFRFEYRQWSLFSKAGVPEKQAIFDLCSYIDREVGYNE